MANFPTHIGIGALASGMLATLTLAADVIAPENLVVVTAAGVLGSVLPDIDLKDSKPSRAMFFGLATFFAFVALFAGAGRYSIAELWILAILTFLFIRYVAFYFFHRFSYHRGIFHSLLAAVFFAFTTAVVYRYVLGRPDGVSWLAGGFMAAGYIVHLTLDEIYSVDVMDTRLKASFGTALKFWDHHHLGHSAMMAAATAGVFLLTPSAKPFVQGVTSPALWSSLRGQLLPQDKWFGAFGPFGRFAGWQATPAIPITTSTPPATGSASSPITTGTIPPIPAPAELPQSQPLQKPE